MNRPIRTGTNASLDGSEKSDRRGMMSSVDKRTGKKRPENYRVGEGG